MPTLNPRLNITLRPEQYDLISRLARLQKRSRSSVLVELLETVIPVLERVAVVGEAAQRAQAQAKEGFRESLERAEAQILPHVQTALGQFDMFLTDVERRAMTTAIQSKDGPAAPVNPRSGSPRPQPLRARTGPRPVTRGPAMGASATTRATRSRRKSLKRRTKRP